MKKLALSISLLLSYAPKTHTNFQPHTLSSELLHLIDGTFIVWEDIGTIQKYITMLENFINKNTFGSEKNTLIELVQSEDNNLLTNEQSALFDKKVLEHFRTFSAPFIATITPLKSKLLSLIQESCEVRNRSDSMLLQWAEASEGQEEDLFKERITTYRIICTFCVDLLHFLTDLVHSCPKANQMYENIRKRYGVVHLQINTILKDKNISLNRESYGQLLSYVNQEYGNNTQATVEKTRSYVNMYNKQYLN